MKTFAFAVLFSAAILTAVNSNPDSSTQAGRCDNAPGMEGCNSETVSSSSSSPSSSSSSSNKDGDVAVPRTMTLRQHIRFDQPTVLDVDEDTVLVSDKAIDTTNLYFNVRKGATLIFRAPAVIITRLEASVRPLFDLSGKVVFEATGSVPVLLDGSRVDEGGLVEGQDVDAVFMSGRDDIVRYHPNGITVSKREGAGDPVDDVDIGSEVCLLTAYYVNIPDVPGSCPSPTFSPAITAKTTPSPGHHEDGTHATAGTDGNGNTSRNTGPTTGSSTSTSTDTSTGTSTNTRTDTSTGSSPGASTGTNAGGGRNSGRERMEHEHEHCRDGHNSNNNNCAKSDQEEASTTIPAPGPTDNGAPDGDSTEANEETSEIAENTSSADDHDDPERGAGKGALTVNGTLTGPLVSPNAQTALWATEIGSIAFIEVTPPSQDAPGHQNTGGFRSSILVAAHVGSVKRVIRARESVLIEMREGGFGSRESSSSRRGVWGWVPFRTQHEKDVERARGHMGEVDMTLTDRACVEVSVDGICVLSKCGPFKREWMNRFPWRRRKSNDYELHVTDDGMEVRLGKKIIWGVTAKYMKD